MISTNDQVIKFLDGKGESKRYYKSKDGIGVDFSRWDSKLMREFIPLTDVEFFKSLCTTQMDFLSKVEYDMVEHIDMFDIICQDIEKSNKGSGYVLPMFRKSPKDYQLRIIRHFENKSNVLLYILGHVMNYRKHEYSKSDNMISFEEIYDSAPSLFDKKKVLDLLYRNIRYAVFDESFFVKIFDKVCPKETNMTLEDFTIREIGKNKFMDDPFMFMESRMIRSWRAHGKDYFGKDHKESYSYDHINKKISFEKEYEQFKKDFPEMRKNLFKGILKNGSYSLDVATSLGYEDVYNEVYKNTWINKSEDQKREGLKILKDDNGEEYIRINSYSKGKEGVIEQKPNYFGYQREGYKYFELNSIPEKDSKSFTKIMFRDIDYCDNYLFPRKYETFNVEVVVPVTKVTMTKEDIAKKLGMNPEDLTISV